MRTTEIIKDWAEKKLPRPCVLVYLDLCDFACFNRMFGHNEADKILNYTETRIRQLCRSDCILYRWGGDEFLLFVPLEPELAEKIIERLRSRLPVAFHSVMMDVADEDLLSCINTVDARLELHKWALD